MKRSEFISRLIVALGAGVLAASFFLPTDSDRRPFMLATNFTQPLREAEAVNWEACFIAGALIVVSVPYLWAACAAIGTLAGRRVERFFAWLMALIQTTGFVVVSGLSLSLIRMEDNWLSPIVMWSALLMPLAIIVGIWLVFLLSSTARRFYALIVLPMIPYAALNFVLAKTVVKYEGDPTGFLAGGVGSLLAAAAAIVVMILRKPGASQAAPSGSAVPPVPVG